MAAAVASASEQISLPPVTVPGSANANSMTKPSSASSPPTSNAASSAPQQPAPATMDRSAQTGDIVQLDRVEDALEAFRRGEFVVVVDDMDRENEGDLIIAAEHVSQQQMAWLIRHSSGYICICLPAERLAQLEIPMMVVDNQDPHRTAYAVTCDYKHGTTTGISAHDRALTARKLADPTTGANDLTRPGHLVPLRAVDGGTLVRRGHTEASVDLCRLSGLRPAGVICELVKPDDPNGDMARRDDCFQFARTHGLRMISIEQIEQYRRENGL